MQYRDYPASPADLYDVIVEFNNVSLLSFGGSALSLIGELCDEPCKCSRLNLEFKVKKEGSYNYNYKKELRPQPHCA